MRIEITESKFNPNNYRSVSLQKTDKNGSKLYRAVGNCPRCGGRGRIEYFYFYAQGVCFECNGSGVKSYSILVRTDEYARKLEENREKKAEQKRLAEIPVATKEVLDRMTKRLGWIKNCKNGPCSQCKHKSYCSLIKTFLEDYRGANYYQNTVEYCPHAYGNLVRDVVSKKEEYVHMLEEVENLDKIESSYETPIQDVEILTLDDKPCRVSNWYETEYGQCRTIFLPDGTKVYSGAKTNRGLNKKGLKLNPSFLKS